jgi:hypothetical protein
MRCSAHLLSMSLALIRRLSSTHSWSSDAAHQKQTTDPPSLQTEIADKQLVLQSAERRCLARGTVSYGRYSMR